MELEAERAAFERYASERWPEADQTFERDGEGYRQFVLNTAWNGWRARADLLSHFVSTGGVTL